MGNLRSMGNHLPEEIITDIISRLPFDSVLECKRVCKTWRTLIYHPSFSQMHLRRSLQLDGDDDDDDISHNCCRGTAAATAAKVSFVCQKDRQLYYGEYNDHDSYKKLTKVNLPPIDFYTLSLHSSCNGLICLTHISIYKDDVYICNPITREYIILPSLVTETTVKNGVPNGFGYSRKTNEYKFVRIYYKDNTSVGHVYVYSLGSSCGWRNIGEINYRCRFGSGVLANGALHWVGNKDGKIVSFDLADEEFRLLPSPPFYNDCCYYNVEVLGGWVCAVYQDVGDDSIMVWSLKKKKGEKGTNYDMVNEQGYQSLSWSLEFIIQGVGMNPFYSNYHVPFFLTKSGMVLLLDGKRRVCRYNLKTASVEPLVNYAPASRIFATILHFNSFVSLDALGEDADN